jgi:hypothetical protein
MVFVFPRRKLLLAVGSLVLAASLAAVFVPRQIDSPRGEIPDRLSDSEFWSLITEFSEAGGYFRSDNFVSNESAFQRVIPDLQRRIKPGGVYLGVGPDQNFTYISALAPKAAFIIDIRRQNMLLHLMYKALFELSGNRSQFLSKLFARPVPEVAKNTSTEQLFAAFGKTGSDPDLASRTLEAIFKQLRDRHHFDLSSEDSKTIEFVYNSFVSAGPEIRYSFPNQYAWRRFPSYSELMLETDGTSEEGKNHSYMASEENFQAVKQMESENRIIPIVGDFAGEKALRAVGRYIRDHGATISTFYTSNVEFYLFQTEDWRKFLNTLSDLPVSSESVIVRSYFNNYSLQFRDPPGWLYSSPQSYTLLDSMPALVDAFASGHIQSYFDIVRRSKP